MTNDTFTPAEELQRKIRTRKLLTWLVVLAIVMFFAGLTSAYVVSMSGGYWVDIRIPNAFYISTVAILISSLTMQGALWSAARGRIGRSVPLLVVTLVLGVVFTWSQFQGWKELVAKGNFVVGKVLANSGTYGVDWTITRNGEPLVLEGGQFYQSSDLKRAKPLNADLEEQKNTSSAYLYVLTAAHLAHLVFGLLSLGVMVVMALRGRYSQEDHVGLWAGATYWHFLGGLWVYLLLFLSLVH
jgi:cytochrome c oxidase subunit 3